MIDRTLTIARVFVEVIARGAAQKARHDKLEPSSSVDGPARVQSIDSARRLCLNTRCTLRLSCEYLSSDELAGR